MADVGMVPLETVVMVGAAILAPMAGAVTWLARALVQSHKDRIAGMEAMQATRAAEAAAAQAARDADAAAAKAAYDARVERHLEDVRAAGSVLAEHQRNTLPLISELAAHFQLANTRAAARQRREEPDSDPPRSHRDRDSETTLTEIRRLVDKGEGPRRPV